MDTAFQSICNQDALRASKQSQKNGIAALVVKNGEIIGRGQNEVDEDCDISRHAEIVAMAEATKKLGHTDLSDCVLYSSLQPCEMCLGAIGFAQIPVVRFAAQRRNVAPKYFVYPGLNLDDFLKASKYDISIEGGILEDEVLHLYVEGDA